MNMKKKSKIEIADLSNKIVNSDLKSVSNTEAAQIVGGSSYFKSLVLLIRSYHGILSRRSP